MILLQIDLDGIGSIPAERDAPRPVDMHCVALREPSQRMKVKSGQVHSIRTDDAIKHVKTPQRTALQINRNLAGVPGFPKLLQTFVPETSDHCESVNLQ
jgi:hypothetical protein